MKLIVFDLDQTLVELLPVHDRTAEALFSQLFGVKARFSEINFAGRTLTDNFAEMARLKGVPEARFRQQSAAMLPRYEAIFKDLVPEDAARHVLPGAFALLDALSERGHFLALYTGDSPGIVRTVFEKTGLGRYFRVFAGGTEAETRVELLRLVIARASRMAGRRFEGKDVVVIGDSVRDMAAAREANVLAIGVTTGIHTKEQLQASGADRVFRSLEDRGSILKAIEKS